MDFSTVCRTCLNSSSLCPIFKSDNNHEIYSRAIYLGTGVQVQFNDGLPQNICTVCMNQINKTLKFRKQCKEVESQLLKVKTELFESSEAGSLVTKCEQASKIKTTVTRTKLFNVQDCFNETEIKIESINSIDVKTELVDNDIDDDKPLKFFINTKVSNTKFIKNNDFVSTKTKKIVANAERADKSASNNAGGDVNENRDWKTQHLYDRLIKKHNIDKHNDTNITPNELLQNNDSLESKNFDESFDEDFIISESYSDSKSIDDPNKSIEVPYNVITDSVTDKTTRVVCKLCQKELSIRSIDSHMARRHPGADERKVKCELCDKYVMKDKLNRHKIMMHGNAGFRCGYCKSDFENKEILVEHVITCTSKKRKRKVNESGRELAECDVCNKTMQRASLKMHKAVKHAGLRPVCEHCGKSFGNKFRLNEHYRAKHGYEKFRCSYCDFRSAGIMALRNHERRHRGEKPYVCDACGAKFHAAYLLAQHKHSHRTEKLVKCDLCPASFKANNSLHMHKLTCHSKAIYRCTICSRTYKCRYYAVKHVRLAHSHHGSPPLVKLMPH